MSDAQTPRHTPYDIEIEQALLGCILVSDSYFWQLEGMLDPVHFYDPLHQRIFETMGERMKRRMGCTPLTLHAAMKSDPGLAEVGGHAYLAGLADAAPALPNIKNIARDVLDLATRRKLIMIGEEIVKRAFEPPSESSPAEQIEDASEKLYGLTRRTDVGRGAINIKDLAYEAIQKAEHAMNNPAEVCLTSGLASVDKNLGGIYRGDLLMLAGAPNMGKSAAALLIGEANGMGQRFQETRLTPEEAKDREKFLTLFFSLEMADWQLGMRDIADRTSIPSSLMRQGKLGTTDIEKMMAEHAAMPDLALKVDGGRKLSVAQIRARCHALHRKSKGKLAMVIIDHLRFIRPADPRADEKDQIQQITQDLKDLAVELNVAIVLLSHLNRDYNKRPNKRPQNSDLYGSSAIEQNADAIWFLHSESYWLERTPPPDTDKDRTKWMMDCEKERGFMEWFSTKARMDKVGMARVRFEPAFTRFSDPEDTVSTPSSPSDLLARGGEPLDELDRRAPPHGR